MPRTARSCSGGYTYHVLNRGNARATVFHNPDDFDAFLDLMAESSVRTPMRWSSLRWLSSPAQAPVRLETAKALNLEHSLRPRGRPRGVEPAGKGKTT
jgi:hypothetical protein